MWETELPRWRNIIYRGRGGPVRLRIEAIATIDEMLAYLENAKRRGAIQPDAEWGALKN